MPEEFAKRVKGIVFRGRFMWREDNVGSYYSPTSFLWYSLTFWIVFLQCFD